MPPSVDVDIVDVLLLVLLVYSILLDFSYYYSITMTCANDENLILFVITF